MNWCLSCHFKLSQSYKISNCMLVLSTSRVCVKVKAKWAHARKWSDFEVICCSHCYKILVCLDSGWSDPNPFFCTTIATRISSFHDSLYDIHYIAKKYLDTCLSSHRNFSDVPFLIIGFNLTFSFSSPGNAVHNVLVFMGIYFLFIFLTILLHICEVKH